MKDPRIKELADILIDYSLNVKKGEYILIKTDEPEALPLMEELYKKILKKGGYPLIRIQPEIFEYLMAKNASKEQIENFLDTEIYEMRKIQGRIRICAPKNSKIMADVDPKKFVLLRKKLGLYRNYLGKIKWMNLHYPTEGLARQMNTTFKETQDFVFKSCLKDWKKETRGMEKIKKVFDGGEIVEIKGNGTNISFSIKGRKGSLSSGKHNMPGGEVYYAPVENSFNGRILFNGLRSYEGKEMKNIFLRFENGKIIKAEADAGEESLNLLIKIDKDSGRVGEFGIGSNYDLDQITNVMLFDEKIGGTIHLALGNSVCPDGKNRSNIHFDILKDLRDQGEIHLDGKLVQKNGKFIFL